MLRITRFATGGSPSGTLGEMEEEGKELLREIEALPKQCRQAVRGESGECLKCRVQADTDGPGAGRTGLSLIAGAAARRRRRTTGADSI